MSKLKNKIAGAYTSFSRAVTEPVMLAPLERPEGGTGITECLYERIQNRLLAKPERYLFRPIEVAILLTRHRSAGVSQSGECVMDKYDAPVDLILGGHAIADTDYGGRGPQTTVNSQIRLPTR